MTEMGKLQLHQPFLLQQLQEAQLRIQHWPLKGLYPKLDQIFQGGIQERMGKASTTPLG